MGDEYFFLGKDHAAHAESQFGNPLAVEFTDILVTVGAEYVVAILMQSEVE